MIQKHTSDQRLATRKQKKLFFFVFSIVAGCSLLVARYAVSCPMCADAVASQNDKAFVDRLTNGFGWSIAVLMCAPYLLFAGVTFLIIHSARRNRRQG